MEKAAFIVRKVLLSIIFLYRYFLSPFLGPNCRFHPTCSCYAEIAIQRFGAIRGVTLSLKRILCCHPWHVGGYDPVPPKTGLQQDP